MPNWKPPPGELKKLPSQQRIFSLIVGVAFGVAISAFTHAGWGLLAFALIWAVLNLYLAHRYNQNSAE